MKTSKLMTSILLSVLMISSTAIFAQGARGNNRANQNMTGQNDCIQRGERMAYLNLTIEQSTQVNALYVDLAKQLNPLRLDLQEKKIQLDRLMIADQPDKSAIMNKADEMSEIRLEMQKLRLGNRMEVRALLDDDQKALFDARTNGKKNHKKGRRSNGNGRRDCRY